MVVFDSKKERMGLKSYRGTVTQRYTHSNVGMNKSAEEKFFIFLDISLHLAYIFSNF